MNRYLTESLNTPILGEYDVIVVGGGPAGIGAALAAARNGASTLIIERFSCLGGMWTSGLVNPLFDYENKGGIVQEIVDLINDAHMNECSDHTYYTFDMEYMKLILDRLMKQAGIDVLFHSFFALPVVENGVIRGITVENKGGREAYLAKRVIDCTGDGDVAARAGAPFRIGRESDNATQPMTLMFKISNMDYIQRYATSDHGNDLYFLMKRALELNGVKDYEFNFVRPCLLKLPGYRTGVMQMTHMRGFDATDPRSLSAAETEGRERVNDAMVFFKRYLPQFEEARLEQTATMIGVRESRRITGEYELTLDDMLAGRRFDDGFATCCFGVDIHQPDGVSQEETGSKYAIRPYQLPYRSLVPLGVENLLVAGRCISGSYEAHASYRVTGDCVAMGQAAGTAAAMSVKERRTPREMDGKRIASVMQEQGAKL